MIFKIKRKEFISEVVGIYFTTHGGDTAYKVISVQDGYVRFAYLENSMKVIVISAVKFTISEFYHNLQKRSLVQINYTDTRIPNSLYNYEAKSSTNVQV
jgi:hypothetical protein